MRSPNKSRGRGRNQGRRSLGNVANRVFESSGPAGKVRGTPQQIIEKYQALARDASLSGDRIAAENFLQHAEHYVRLLAEAQREMEERRRAEEAEAERRRLEREAREARRRAEREAREAARAAERAAQAAREEEAQGGESAAGVPSDLPAVATGSAGGAEGETGRRRAGRGRRPNRRKGGTEAVAESGQEEAVARPAAEGAGEAAPAEEGSGDAPRRSRRRSKAAEAEPEGAAVVELVEEDGPILVETPESRKEAASLAEDDLPPASAAG